MRCSGRSSTRTRRRPTARRSASTPEWAACHAALGSALSRQGRHAQAATAYREAIRLRPGECRLQPGPGAHALRAKAVRRCGDGLPRGDPPRPRAGCLPRCARWRAIPTGAVRASRDGLPRGDPPRPGECRLQPGSGAHAFRARADTRMRRRPTARRSASTRRVPSTADDLGDALCGQELNADAETAYREAIRLDPNDAESTTDLGTRLCGPERYADVGDGLPRGDPARPRSRQRPQRPGQRPYGPEAVRRRPEPAYREAIRLDPESRLRPLRPGRRRSWARSGIRRPEPAYREAIRLDPDNANAHNGLGRRPEETRSGTRRPRPAYREAIRLDPENADAHDQDLGARALDGRKRYADAGAGLPRGDPPRPG